MCCRVAGLGLLRGYLFPRCWIGHEDQNTVGHPSRQIEVHCDSCRKRPRNLTGFKVDLPVKYQKVRGQQVGLAFQQMVRMSERMLNRRLGIKTCAPGFLSHQALLHVQHSHHPVPWTTDPDPTDPRVPEIAIPTKADGTGVQPVLLVAVALQAKWFR